MANAVWLWVVEAASPLIGAINEMAVKSVGSFIYEIAILGVAIYFGHWYRSQLRLGILWWILFSLIVYGFFMSLGIGFSQVTP